MKNKMIKDYNKYYKAYSFIRNVYVGLLASDIEDVIDTSDIDVLRDAYVDLLSDIQDIINYTEQTGDLKEAWDEM